MKKVSWVVVIAGAVVGLAAVVLTHLGNPANMGFCIACFIRDTAGALGTHRAAAVQYIRPEIIGVVLAYAIKSVLENLSKNNHWPDKPDPIAPAAEEEPADQPSNDL